MTPELGASDAGHPVGVGEEEAGLGERRSSVAAHVDQSAQLLNLLRQLREEGENYILYSLITRVAPDSGFTIRLRIVANRIVQPDSENHRYITT